MNTTKTSITGSRTGAIRGSWSLAVLLWLSPISIASALELVMVEQAICPYCKRFDAEIMPDYSERLAGQTVPLRRVDITDPWPEDLAKIKPDRLTPTFILVDEGEEIGRLRGYPGKEEFWQLLLQLLEQHTGD